MATTNAIAPAAISQLVMCLASGAGGIRTPDISTLNISGKGDTHTRMDKFFSGVHWTVRAAFLLGGGLISACAAQLPESLQLAGLVTGAALATYGLIGIVWYVLRRGRRKPVVFIDVKDEYALVQGHQIRWYRFKVTNGGGQSVKCTAHLYDYSRHGGQPIMNQSPMQLWWSTQSESRLNDEIIIKPKDHTFFNLVYAYPLEIRSAFHRLPLRSKRKDTT